LNLSLKEGVEGFLVWSRKVSQSHGSCFCPSAALCALCALCVGERV
jgi:hypothetical protein